ncbi:MAG TPA: DUF2845 domain-containing protein [Polyangia bacterium]|nr:DUF2845 domain-containing protein [Polyangia bacterium]
MRTLARCGLACALLWLVAGRARADDGMRCGEWLVGVGATAGEVRCKCGPPTETYTSVEYSETDYGTIARTIDHWVYNRGPSELIRMLSFRAGVLVHVAIGNYGY